jgi:predicted dienelactone hydrolase
MRRLPAALLALTFVALAACGSSDGDDADDAGPTTVEAPTTTTLSVAEAAAAYTEAGPYPVGVTTLELEGGVPVEVWYPAVEGTTGEVAYDVRDKVPPAMEALLTADVPAVYRYAAGRDADAASGTFPLVLFSHGFTGVREQSSFLTSHLASWGMVVAAPDHWSRDLYHVLDGALGGQEVDANDPADDLRQTRELIALEHATADSILEGHVDTSRIGAVGHSAGGGTVLDIATDDGIAGYVSLASGARLGGAPDPDGATTTTTPLELPDVPSLFVAGSVDAVVPWDEATKPAFDAAPAPSRFWLIEGAGHNAFDDFCTFGDGKGIIGVAEASGLGGFLDAAPQFRSLGSDGCVPPAVPVADTFPVIRHVVTAWLRELFGADPEPVGLSDTVADEFAVPVTIEEKL